MSQKLPHLHMAAVAKLKAEGQNEHRSAMMKSSAKVFDPNSSHWHVPFVEIDIHTAMLGEWMASSSQQKDDSALVQKLYSKCWKVLHHDMTREMKNPNHVDTVQIVAIFNALSRLKLVHLLTEGLPNRVTTWLSQAIESSKER